MVWMVHNVGDLRTTMTEPMQKQWTGTDAASSLERYKSAFSVDDKL